MKQRQPAKNYDTIGSIIGIIIFIGIPFAMLFWYQSTHRDGSATNSSETQEYSDWKAEQRADQPTDYNGDGTITRDEAEDNPNVSDSYSCTSDCSGHQAGYDWARSNNVCDPSYSSGKSQSFNEGVRAWSAQGC